MEARLLGLCRDAEQGGFAPPSYQANLLTQSRAPKT